MGRDKRSISLFPVWQGRYFTAQTVQTYTCVRTKEILYDAKSFFVSASGGKNTEIGQSAVKASR